MDNYEKIKEYEAHKTPVPSYEKWKSAQEQLQKDGVWYTEISHKKVLRENKQLKNLLKEIRGKLHYINTPVNRHNIFSNDFIKKLDQVLGDNIDEKDK